jgi:ferredoxin
LKAGGYIGYAACSGCSLCLLPCPVWHATRDIRLTPHGRAKALQHGATASDLVKSIDSCTLCGACEPSCPEDIELVDMLLGLRSELNCADTMRTARFDEQMRLRSAQAAPQSSAPIQIVPDRAMIAEAAVLERVVKLFGGNTCASIAADNGADIALALEAGAAIPEARRTSFLASLGKARQIIVCDGVLLRALRGWLPGRDIESLGLASSSLPAVRKQLRASDFYVIESRAYHADRERLVVHYDALRMSKGCAMNLDLQRLAMPTTAGSLPELLGQNVVDAKEQASWILEGREFSRIIVEDLSELAAFRAVTAKPVIHVAQLVDVN